MVKDLQDMILWGAGAFLLHYVWKIHESLGTIISQLSEIIKQRKP